VSYPGLDRLRCALRDMAPYAEGLSGIVWA
jgi:hypothetical protein